MKSSWSFSSNEKGIVLSIGLHLFILAFAYYIQCMPASGGADAQPYRIAFQSATTYTVATHSPSSRTPKKHLQAAHSVTTKPPVTSKHPLQKASTPLQRQCQKQASGLHLPQKLAQPPKAPKIDERGLYKSGKNPAKQTGATLELRGWEWDTMPNPNDTTEECGKIVFEIKVDKDGEIISIQTIEKTVTPMVEKIYADALRGLTFSKTAEARFDISTGKVTFVLVGK